MKVAASGALLGVNVGSEEEGDREGFEEGSSAKAGDLEGQMSKS